MKFSLSLYFYRNKQNNKTVFIVIDIFTVYKAISFFKH